MKKEPWRIVIFAVAVIYIIGMWVKKDMGAIFSGMGENAIPVLIMTIGINVLKVLLFTGVILLVKWIVSKFGGKR